MGGTRKELELKVNISQLLTFQGHNFKIIDTDLGLHQGKHVCLEVEKGCRLLRGPGHDACLWRVGLPPLQNSWCCHTQWLTLRQQKNRLVPHCTLSFSDVTFQEMPQEKGHFIMDGWVGGWRLVWKQKVYQYCPGF